MGKLKKLTLSYGEKIILNGLNGELRKGACIAVVGSNGAGKTTLLKLLSGELRPTTGEIAWNGKRPSVSYFEQEAQPAEVTDWSSKEIQLYNSKWKIPNGVAYDSASGGEQMKLRLAAALAEKSELLLLDEPTNHLDQESLDILAGIIKREKRTVVMVSHDRYFIDQTADIIFEIEHGALNVYEGNYSAYRKRKETEHAIQQKHYEQQQRKISHVEKQLKSLSDWSDKAHRDSTKKDGTKEYFRMKAKKRDVQIKSKQKRLESEIEKDRVVKPKDEQTVHFSIKGNRKVGKRVLELRNVGKSFGERCLFRDVNFTVQAGERLALVGENGSGKSTFFKMINGKEDFSGEIWLTNGMKIGYLSQTTVDFPEGQTVDSYFGVNNLEEQGKLRVYLDNLGLKASHWELPLSALSQGESLKVRLMQFILQETDVLLLDEPTNHLDLASREELERTLATFPGTLLFASHDRYFVERLSKGLLVFGQEEIQKIPMTLREWEQRNSSVSSADKREEERMILETELQAVLGKLSMKNSKDPSYAELDKEFHRLNKQLLDLKNKK